jgi:hypothetical protein
MSSFRDTYGPTAINIMMKKQGTTPHFYIVYFPENLHEISDFEMRSAYTHYMHHRSRRVGTSKEKNAKQGLWAAVLDTGSDALEVHRLKVISNAANGDSMAYCKSGPGLTNGQQRKLDFLLKWEEENESSSGSGSSSSESASPPPRRFGRAKWKRS